jgi:hypothetical protein
MRAVMFDRSDIWSARRFTLRARAALYLVLPTPRLAVTRSANDALAKYASSQPGWPVASPEDLRVGHSVANHVGRGWWPEALRRPTQEGWRAVVREVVAVLEQRTGLR